MVLTQIINSSVPIPFWYFILKIMPGKNVGVLHQAFINSKYLEKKYFSI